MPRPRRPSEGRGPPGGVFPIGIFGRPPACSTRGDYLQQVLSELPGLFAALELDESETPPVAYRQETDRNSGRGHCADRFGFVTSPADPGVTGDYI